MHARADIIALLIIGVILLIIFLFWQHYLETVQNDPDAPYSWFTPPPLMKLSLWTRANGRFSAMMAIAFTNWCAFMSWTYWVQVRVSSDMIICVQICLETDFSYGLALLPELQGLFCDADRRAAATDVCIGDSVQCICGSHGCPCRCSLARWYVVDKNLKFFKVDSSIVIAIGAGATASACLLFAIIKPDSTYWAYAFNASYLSVMGADFVFSAGTLFIAKFSLPHEQSVSGALFNTMTQVGPLFSYVTL